MSHAGWSSREVMTASCAWLITAAHLLVVLVTTSLTVYQRAGAEKVPLCSGCWDGVRMGCCRLPSAAAVQRDRSWAA